MEPTINWRSCLLKKIKTFKKGAPKNSNACAESANKRSSTQIKRKLLNQALAYMWSELSKKHENNNHARF